MALKNIITNKQISFLSSIVQVGDAAYQELIESQHSLFRHPYFSDIKGRLRTKLVQIQCELESHNPEFPFEFSQRQFRYTQTIPELRSKNVLLHIARSSKSGILPYKSKYRINLSNNNDSLCRQMILDFDNTPPYHLEPFYGILVFGGRKETFIEIQFPSPGYRGIAEIISIPNIIPTIQPEATEVFERKKVALKKEFLTHISEEAISS